MYMDGLQIYIVSIIHKNMKVDFFTLAIYKLTLEKRK